MTSGLRGEPAWRRSTACESGACVEVAATDEAVMIRNPEIPDDVPVTLSHAEWQGLLGAMKDGVFDRI